MLFIQSFVTTSTAAFGIFIRIVVKYDAYRAPNPSFFRMERNAT